MARSLGQLEAKCVGKFVVALAYLDYPSQDGIQLKTRQDLRVLLQGAHANIGNIIWWHSTFVWQLIHCLCALRGRQSKWMLSQLTFPESECWTKEKTQQETMLAWSAYKLSCLLSVPFSHPPSHPVKKVRIGFFVVYWSYMGRLAWRECCFWNWHWIDIFETAATVERLVSCVYTHCVSWAYTCCVQT